MRSTFKVLFYLKRNKEKTQSAVPVMGRITVNGTISQFSAKLTVPERLWEVRGGRAKGRSLEADRINRHLDEIRSQLDRHYRDIRDRESYVTAEKVKNAWLGFGKRYRTLLATFRSFTDDLHRRIGVDRSKNTWYRYLATMKHLQAFLTAKYHVSDIALAELELSRPEKGLQKRVNLMQQTTNSDLSRHYLPRLLRHLILQEYLSGVKTARQLSEEHGIPMSTIHKMGQRWKAKNSCSFVSTPNPYPIMSRVTSEEASELLSENKALRRRLEEALLRLEGYEIMGDILQEEYGIDLLKKSAAGQSSVSKKDTQQ